MTGTHSMRIDQTTLSIPLLALALIFGLPALAAGTPNPEERHIIGWIETVQISPENIALSAKIDTGADHSSLNVIDVRAFKKGEEEWIRFSIPLDKVEAVTFERPILRFAKIKRKGGTSQKRPVVALDICVGKIFKKEVVVNLADRTGFKYPMLIGRSFLKGVAMVDSSLTFTQSPSCIVQ